MSDSYENAVQLKILFYPLSRGRALDAFAFDAFTAWSSVGCRTSVFGKLGLLFMLSPCSDEPVFESFLVRQSSMSDTQSPCKLVRFNSRVELLIDDNPGPGNSLSSDATERHAESTPRSRCYPMAIAVVSLTVASCALLFLLCEPSGPYSMTT